MVKLGQAIKQIFHGNYAVKTTDLQTELIEFMTAVRKAPEHWRDNNSSPAEYETSKNFILAIDRFLKNIQDIDQ